MDTGLKSNDLDIDTMVLRSRKTRRRPADSVAGLIFLSGIGRGSVIRLEQSTMHLIGTEDGRLRVVHDPGEEPGEILARLHRSEETYELEVKRDARVRLNGSRVLTALLDPGDMLEVESPSALLRFDQLPKHGDERVDLDTLFNDCFNVTLHESRSKAGFLARLPINFLRDISVRTTRIFRFTLSVSMIIVIVILLSVFHSIGQVRDQQIVDRQALEALGEWFRSREPGFISRQELDHLRTELSEGMVSAEQRLKSLEQQSGAAARVIGHASRAVVFLQGTYTYIEKSSGRPMRYAITAQGYPLVTRNGEPLTTLEGAGPVARHQFTGTAFVIDEAGTLMTNRHVAYPWEDDEQLAPLAELGVFPEIERFQGYLPGRDQPFEVSTLKVSDTADLAMLQCAGVTEGIPHIPMSSGSLVPGDEVFVLGYPTGLRALLARTNEAFLEEVRQGSMDYWSIAARLSESGHIQPLASRGIVGQISSSAIAYDADTTRGGSGGPVLNADGELVAVNSAILPEYGGSNLGVPVEQVRKLLATEL